MAITFEETVQTVLNLVQEREALKVKVTQLEAELHAIRKSDVAKMEPIRVVKENK